MATLSLAAKLGLDKTGFDAGMTAATRRSQKFGADMKAAIAGAFTMAVASQFLRGVGQSVERIKDLSEQFGITTDEVQNLDFALKQSGLSFESLSGPMNKIIMARREALENDGKMRESFKQAGVSLEQLANPAVRWVDILTQMSRAMAEGKIKGDAQSFVMDLLGVKSAKLANILKDLSTIKAPTLFEQREIEKIDEASKAMERFKLATQTAVSSAIGNWLDYWDVVTGKHAKTEFFANRPITKMEIDAASKAKQERMAVAEAARDAANVGERIDPKRTISEVADLIRLLGGIGAPNVAAAEKGSGLHGIESDQFQRIGAFTGSGTNSTIGQLQRQTHEIAELRKDITTRGVMVKGTD